MPSALGIKATASDLFDIPLEERGAGDHALDVLAIGGLRFPRPNGDIGQGLESALLDQRGDLLAGLGIAGLDPLGAQGLNLVIARPAEPCRFAVAAQRLV